MGTTEGLWYFAHPYTCKDADGKYVLAGEEANFRLCCYRAGRLILAGYNVYAPVCHTHPIHVATPEFLSRHEHELWYKLDNDYMAYVNWAGLILAPGWEYSTGCCDERAHFEAMKLRIHEYSAIIIGD